MSNDNAVHAARALAGYVRGSQFYSAMHDGRFDVPVVRYADWRGDERVVLEMSDGTWLTVTVEQSEENPQ